MSLFGTIFYGGGQFYGPTGTDVPQDLKFYRTNIDGIYVFYWGFRFDFITPALESLDFELQLDSTPNFNSPNLTSFKSYNVEDMTHPAAPVFQIVQVVDSTTLNVTSVSGLTIGDTITQNLTGAVTTITSIGTSSIIVGSTTGFMATNVNNYQNGNVRKGFAVPVPARVDKTQLVWYAQVRTTSGVSSSAWSATLQFVIPEKFEVQEAENLLTNLPDIHVYGKEDLKKAVAQRNTNLYTVCDMYGKELDQIELENILTTTNNYIDLCRDENLFNNFGIFFNYQRTQIQQYVEYRETLRALILGSLEGSTNEAIQFIARSFTGVNATLKLIRDLEDFFLSTIQETPPQIPNNIITFFSTSSDYVPGSLVLYKNGVLQVSGVDYTENHATPGYDFAIPPTLGSLIVATFTIGAVGDPEAAVWDLLDYTPLTGLITQTNGSALITGTGTLFTTELNPGDTIIDAAGQDFFVVESVTDNTHLTLTEPSVFPSGTSSGFKLRYNETQVPPSVLWDQTALAHGIIIEINNPGDFILDQALIKTLISLLLPAHVKVFFVFL